MSDRTMNLTAIGKHYGISGKKAGVLLHKVGLRHKDGTPTKLAIDGGFCKEVYAGEERNVWFFVWYASKTLALLEKSIQHPAAFAAARRERAAAEKATKHNDEIEGEECAKS